jgi:hypothetical protein
MTAVILGRQHDLTIAQRATQRGDGFAVSRYARSRHVPSSRFPVVSLTGSHGDALNGAAIRSENSGKIEELEGDGISVIADFRLRQSS